MHIYICVDICLNMTDSDDNWIGLYILNLSSFHSIPGFQERVKEFLVLLYLVSIRTVFAHTLFS